MMFDKEFWNKEENVNTNNCYTYAIDRPFTRNGHLLKFETSPVLSCKAISYIIDQGGVIPTESNGNVRMVIIRYSLLWVLILIFIFIDRAMMVAGPTSEGMIQYLRLIVLAM